MGPLIQKKEERIKTQKKEQTTNNRNQRLSTAPGNDGTDDKPGFGVMTQTIQMTISGSIGYILDYS